MEDIKRLIIYTDGGSRNNPGPAAAAFVVRSSNGQILAEEGTYLGIATNNEAEYQAVKKAFEKVLSDLAKLLPVEIEIRTDSQLLANQLAGKYKVKNERLLVLVQEIKKLESQLGEVIYTQIPRSENFHADKLVNLALDEQLH